MGKTCTDQLCTMRPATWINKINNARLTHTSDSQWQWTNGPFTWPALDKSFNTNRFSLRYVCLCFHLLWGIKCVDRSPKAFWISSRQDKTHSPWGETQLRCLRVYVCLYSVNCIHPYTCLKRKLRGKAIFFFSLVHR